jgi:hypothetical protein
MRLIYRGVISTVTVGRNLVDRPKDTNDTIIEVNEAKTRCRIPHIKDVDVELVVSCFAGAVGQ